MKHRATPRFRACYRALPVAVRESADRSFELLVQDRRHSSLKLKKIGAYRSVRVGLHYRSQ